MEKLVENRLAEKSIGFWLLVGQGISGIAPLVAMTSVLTASAIFAEGSVTLSYILGCYGSIPYSQYNFSIFN
ncbi:MAG: hypothetical protein QXX23_05765 [Thermoplasmata archaeon]